MTTEEAPLELTQFERIAGYEHMSSKHAHPTTTPYRVVYKRTPSGRMASKHQPFVVTSHHEWTDYDPILDSTIPRAELTGHMQDARIKLPPAVLIYHVDNPDVRLPMAVYTISRTTVRLTGSGSVYTLGNLPPTVPLG